MQGIFFRESAKETALALGIKGFARNEADGSVLIEAEGEPEALGEFLRWCRRGPEMAQVEKIEIKEGVIRNFKDFRVL